MSGVASNDETTFSETLNFGRGAPKFVQPTTRLARTLSANRKEPFRPTRKPETGFKLKIGFFEYAGAFHIQKSSRYGSELKVFAQLEGSVVFPRVPLMRVEVGVVGRSFVSPPFTVGPPPAHPTPGV